MKLGISDKGFRRLAQVNLDSYIEALVEANEAYRGAYEVWTETEDFKLREADEVYKQKVLELLEALLEPYQPGFSISKDYDASSAYFDITYTHPEDDDYYDSFQVRASNHEIKYSGPIWSFNTDHDSSVIRYGVNLIQEHVEEMLEDVNRDFEESQEL